ncbi:TBC1 domain family member 5 [Lucilia sericata]|uniref:TBC1 domain family member 5 n=1 Tax=Lucilia sericata TaxID=13632 RepID=UPI0018A81768|nr:TBC1 domain family member 5 [Lucilia sericata]
MTVRGIEAIKLYMPPNTGKLDANVREEKDTSTTLNDKKSLETTMTSVERYRQEWLQLLKTLDDKPETIRDLAFEGHLKISKFRSVYWSLLLRVLNEDHRTWCLQREQQRKCYEKLKQEFAKNPHQLDGNLSNENDDPLSQSSQSVWNQYFSDQELFAVIRQDVVRTFPGVDFFRKPLVQNSMCNILFYYAREHPYMCYRQGMHEILAPVIFVMYGDHQSLLHFREIAKDVEIDNTLLNVLNPSYLEADSYFIFSRIMASIESYYRVSNNLPTKLNGANSPLSTSEIENNPNYSSEIEVVGQLNLIRDKILAKEDLHLHNYLMKLDIPLHIFGIRWLRLLFGREFALLDLLVLWDAIFADSDRFDLPNYIVVAMLIRIRDKLLLSDYTTCLTYLMRYPTNVDISLILRHALYMQMPKKYDRPTNAFVYFNMPSINRANQAADNSESYNKTSNGEQMNRIRSTSLGDNAARMERQITLMQTRNAADEALMARLKQASEENRLAMDGYKDNNPELVRLELKNAQTVITVARSKLQTYLNTIRHHMSKQSSPEVANALDGIDELCQFLDVKFMFPLHSRSGPIDQALEANEQQLRNQKQKTEISKKSIKPDLNPLLHSERSNVSTSAVQEDNGMVDEHVCSYEKPDIGFMLQSTRLLGNTKEIELIPIVSDEKIVDPLNANRSKNNVGLPVADPTNFNC